MWLQEDARSHLLNASHWIQENRIMECMRRVNPGGVLLRSLELQTVGSEEKKFSSQSSCFWYIDGNRRLIGCIHKKTLS